LFGFSRGLTIYAIFLGFYLIIYGLFIRRPIKDTREKLIENNFEL